MKLNAVIAIEQGTKRKGNEAKSEAYKIAQKPSLFNGFVKKYRTKFEGGESFPDESQKVQVRATELVSGLAKVMNTLFNVEATKDYANTVAKADVVVEGKVLVSGAPTTFLLYLQKELTDLDTFISALPVLPDDDTWQYDATGNLHKTEVTQTIRTKKVQKPLVLYPATDKHPAQTQLITEDETVGFWETIKQSGAMTIDEKKELQRRLQQLSDAVKSAREQANMTEAVDNKAGDALVRFLFA